MIANNIIAFNSSGILITASYPGWVSGWGNNNVYNPDGYNYNKTDPTGLYGNISVDPGLADWRHGNGHLQPGSPCVGSGDNAQVLAGHTDVDGQARIQGGLVDIGADESDGVTHTDGPYTIIKVATTGSDENAGVSWTAPKRTIGAALLAAAERGGEVWVASGAYEETIGLLPFVHLYGGFNGDEGARGDRLPVPRTLDDPRQSVIDANRGGSVVTGLAGHHVATIDGFTITDGSGSGTYDSKLRGGGLYCVAASVTFSNNIVADNRLTNCQYANGGGVYLADSSSIIANNIICRNTIRSAYGSGGGGIHCQGGSPEIVNNVIVANSDGGGINCESSARVTNSTIVNNTPAGIYCGPNVTTFANNIVAFNHSGVNGSAGTMVNNNVFGHDGYNYSGVDPTGVDGNISVDPLLVDMFRGDLHIQPTSPCRGAGDNAYASTDQGDIDTQNRIQDGTVDIGADESDGTAWPQTAPRIIHVSPRGNDANNGLDWMQAKRTVQAGIDTATPLWGDVWVAQGVYNERVALGASGRVYGGFRGRETAFSERDFYSARAIIDGGAGGSVVTIDGGYRGIVLDGLTLRDGDNQLGGAVYCDASAEIANCLMTDNTAMAGAAIYVALGRSPLIINNVIANNTSGESGATLYCNRDTSAIVVNNTIVHNNTAAVWGYRSWSQFTNNIVAFNTSGFLEQDDGVAWISLSHNCVFGNTLRDYGSPVPGVSDFSLDPLLLSDYRLSAISPCIDTGATDTASPIDFHGNPRPFDVPARGAEGPGIAYDIGADEYLPGSSQWHMW